jgi:hypothetical protein
MQPSRRTERAVRGHSVTAAAEASTCEGQGVGSVLGSGVGRGPGGAQGASRQKADFLTSMIESAAARNMKGTTD